MVAKEIEIDLNYGRFCGSAIKGVITFIFCVCVCGHSVLVEEVRQLVSCQPSRSWWKPAHLVYKGRAIAC